jgi:polyhydroxybutyrate depolymerase
VKRVLLRVTVLSFGLALLLTGATATFASNASSAATPSSRPASPAVVWPVADPAAPIAGEPVAVVGGLCRSDHTAGDFIESAGGRAYRLHLPAGVGIGAPAPLVLNFHGSGRTAADQEAYSGLVPIADREGFVLVTPEGSGSPSGWDIPDVYHDIGVDDVAFTQDVVAAVESELCIDSARIYATGMSNGAEMASQLACDLPGLFAAVAPVAGVLYQGCATPVPILAFHGTADANILFAWTQPALEGWAATNGCANGVETETVAAGVERERYASCSGSDIEFYVVEGGGHTWPGATDGQGVGYTTHEISAAELMWQFFEAHPRR